jgi:hypothetical protein
MRSNLWINWKLISSTLLWPTAFSAVWIEPAREQSQEKQDIQQLRDKLQRLDQMMDEVRAEISALELRL